MDLGLKDKVAVITGGSLGIGLAVAEGLAQEGVHVALCARNEERVCEAAQQIAAKHGVSTFALKADVSRADDLAQFVAEVEKTFGGADILINNAGTGGGETILDAPDEKWQHYWDLHVMAAVRLARARPLDARAGWGGDPQQRLHLCHAASTLRADLQRHQGRPGHVLQVPGE